MPALDRPGATRENQKRGLEGVFHVVDVAEQATTDPQHHRSMSDHQRCEGGFVAGCDEATEKVALGQPGDRLAAVNLTEIGENTAMVHHLANSSKATARAFVTSFCGDPRFQSLFLSEPAQWGTRHFAA